MAFKISFWTSLGVHYGSEHFTLRVICLPLGQTWSSLNCRLLENHSNDPMILYTLVYRTLALRIPWSLSHGYVILIASGNVFVLFVRSPDWLNYSRGVDNLKNKVTPEVYNRLMKFMYLPSKEAVHEFTEWVASLNQAQVKGVYLFPCRISTHFVTSLAWWDHKLQPFILSGIIQCCSSMSAESWALTDATTNINEAQHAWTNKFTGTKLSLVEAILRQVSVSLVLSWILLSVSARKLDFNTLKEVENSLKSGVLKNSRNSEFDRTTRKLNRQARKTKKKKQRDSQNDVISDLRQKVADAKAATKEFQDKLKTVTGSKARGPRKQAAESSSSGRAPAIRPSKAQARTVADPYPIDSELIKSLNSHIWFCVGNPPPARTGDMPLLLAPTPSIMSAREFRLSFASCSKTNSFIHRSNC